jgi:hypothetical protein
VAGRQPLVTEHKAGQIGRITTAGGVTEFSQGMTGFPDLITALNGVRQT